MNPEEGAIAKFGPIVLGWILSAVVAFGLWSARLSVIERVAQEHERRISVIEDAQRETARTLSRVEALLDRIETRNERDDANASRERER